jgi:hypothetical protein
MSIEEVAKVIQQGQVFKLKATGMDGQPLWAYRYRLEGRGSTRPPQVGGFATRTDALKALEKVLARLGPGGRAATMTLGELVNEYLEMHQAEPVTIAKLLAAREGDRDPRGAAAGGALAEGRLRVAADGPGGASLRSHAGTSPSAEPCCRLGADRLQPGQAGRPEPGPAFEEKRPFDSWQQIEAVAERLGPVYGPMIVFAAATGLRPSELFALEHRDTDRGAGVVYVRRAYANGRLKHTKTRLSTRAVPLQSIALEALDHLPRSENSILFPNSRGGRIDFRSFGRRHWKPAQTKAGVEPRRHLYDLRHTYATFALRAGVTQLVAARTVAEALADLATAPESPRAPGSNGTPITEIAGPRGEDLAEMARLLVARRGDPVRIEGVSNPDDPDGDLYENGALLPGPQATLAGPTFEEWLSRET